MDTNKWKRQSLKSVKDKHLQNARTSSSSARRSLLMGLATSGEDFELNKLDIAYAWPRLSKLSTNDDSPSAACLKLLHIGNN
ncbi:hypothetical protein GJ496_008274 [Pomphorhynchus laevis]|nr:hypothetical protein GJ496_008274 [Pomphorhynchus laevis]